MKKRQTVLIAIIAVIALLLGFNFRLVWLVGCNMLSPKTEIGETLSWPGGSYERISYGESEAQYVDLYVPEGVENPPLLVIVHGGGFVANDAQAKQARFFIRYFRDHGFACASVNYRLAGQAAFPAACDDVRDAVHFLTEKAGEYGYNADKIAIYGESAGGYLATREALTETQSNICALVSYYGVYDMDVMDEQFRAQGVPRLLRKLANMWASGNLGGYDSCEEYWVRKAHSSWSEEDKKALSVQYIAEQTAENSELKSYLLAGSADITVPYAQSERMAEALKARYGADSVSFTLLPRMIHADDRMFSDAQLGDVERFLRNALK